MSEQKMNGNQHEFNAFEREFFAEYQGELSGVCLSDDAKARLKGKLCQAVVAKAAARAVLEPRKLRRRRMQRCPSMCRRRCSRCRHERRRTLLPPWR